MVMTKEEREKVVERVKKLYAVAGDGAASQGEIENAMKMARRLLEKYNLSMQELETKDKEFVLVLAFGGKTNRPSWQRNLLLVICEYYLTTLTVRARWEKPVDERKHEWDTVSHSGNNIRQFVVIGTPENVELTNYTLSYLLGEFSRLGDAFMKEYKSTRSSFLQKGGDYEMGTSSKDIQPCQGEEQFLPWANYWAHICAEEGAGR